MFGLKGARTVPMSYCSASSTLGQSSASANEAAQVKNKSAPLPILNLYSYVSTVCM